MQRLTRGVRADPARFFVPLYRRGTSLTKKKNHALSIAQVRKRRANVRAALPVKLNAPPSSHRPSLLAAPYPAAHGHADKGHQPVQT